jgi:acyl carrier protein
MVPSYFVSLERIPLTPNGKIDRRALPVPEPEAEETHTAPRNDIEKEMAGIWSEVLGVEKDTIGIDTNFFQLGGHSLKATVMIAKLQGKFNVKVPLAAVFKTPNIRGLAEFITGLAEHKYASIEPAEKKDYYLLSSAQKRLYILQQVDPESTAYNMPGAVPLSGEADLEKLKQAFIKLIERHESLRTSFHMIANEPIQRIREKVEVKFEVEESDAIQHSKFIIHNFIRPFDLSHAPLLRLDLIKQEGKHLLLVDMHHIISDGISHQVLTREFMTLYAAHGNPLPPLRLQYKDYALWQNNDEMQQIIKQQEEYWLKQFAEGVPVLELPTDYKRDQVQGYEGSVFEFFINEEDTRLLKALALNEDATLYMVLLALFNIMLSKLSGQQDIVVGTIVAGRGHPDLESIIGVFINTLALRNFPAEEKTFTDILGEVKDRTLKSFENQDYPFEELVNHLQAGREGNRNPVFDVLFSFQTIEMPELEIPGVEKESLAVQGVISKFDLTLDGYEEEEKLHLFFEYRTRLFDEETVSLWADCFKEIVSAVMTDSKVKLKDITLSYHLAEIKTDTEEQRKAFGF